MLEDVRFLASRLRRAPILNRLDWFWNTVTPLWRRAMAAFTDGRGFKTFVNGDAFYLNEVYGAPFGRRSQRTYEPIPYHAFTSEIRPGRRVEHGRVYAFEPNDEAATVLAEHVRLNHWTDRVDIVRAAASDVEGSVVFYTSGVTTAASLGRANVEGPLNRAPLAHPVRDVRVDAVTLDGFCQRRGLVPDLIKVDAEGAEVQVLRGARGLLLAHDVVVHCEVHPRQMVACGASVEALQGFLDDVGYAMTTLDTPTRGGTYHVRIARPRPAQRRRTTDPGRSILTSLRP